ncbi:glycoside hydrolase family 47 protein [Crepidotus variabilis]|uniref:alpha-1,2-Mannosidase n=1 Tax=Crepidotus variabilis TaxID=179855 RepID=A0A9P6JQC7_9AGAR|nr:glycoside hydrolase family 47 protein [Crepidotus variabilis]
MLQDLIRSKPWRRGFFFLLALLTFGFLSTNTFPHISAPRFSLGRYKCMTFGWVGSASRCRAEKVKEAFVHAYHGYEKYAMPNDELRPVTNGFSNEYGRWAATAVDSLDTMILMGLKDEYKRALDHIKDMSFEISTIKPGLEVRFFETVIRYLGGLLSAYALSGDKVLLFRAEELANTLEVAFDSPTGLPSFSFILDSHRRLRKKGGENSNIADVSSLHLEYTYLAAATGNYKYLNRTTHIINMLSKANVSDSNGMLSVWWSQKTGLPQGAYISVGALADSAHEYLLKLYLLTGKTDKRSIEMYIRMTTQVITHLLYLSPHRNMLYVTDAYDLKSTPSHKLEHLACFFPGLLALGAHTLPLDNLASIGIDPNQIFSSALHGLGRADFERLSNYNLTEVHMWAAEGLAQTCYLSYADQATGLGPDEMWMSTKAASKPKLWINALDTWRLEGSKGSWSRGKMMGKSIPPGLQNGKPMKDPTRRDYTLKATNYLLRPETVESLYILWRLTGQAKYREWAWNIFEAIEKVAKTESGYTHIVHVDIDPPKRGDIMPSFFLAETLKYLYLIFLDDDPLPLDKWVFNTEAHPLPVFRWTEAEKKKMSLIH